MDQPRVLANLSAAEFASLSPGDLMPMSTSRAWLGKRSYEGRWWLSAIGAHIEFASLVERDALMILDYRSTIEQICRDPFIFLPAKGAPRPTRLPWLYVQSTSGARKLLSHSRDAVVSASFRGSKLMIEESPTLPTTAMRNIRWLSPYRDDRFRLPADQEAAVRRLASSKTPIDALVASAAAVDDAPAVRANVYSQLWRGLFELLAPDMPLSGRSEVVAS